MPERHPDDDLLADLAADVLPADRARAVEAHVLACTRCSGLLEDAERMRSLLLSGDPGPVPADVWQRIEAALSADARPAQVPQTGPGHTGDTAAFQAFVDASGPPRVAAVPASPGSPSPDAQDDSGGWTEDADPLDDPARWGGRAAASRRVVNSGSRRDARTDSRRRPAPLLLAAAAVLAIIAVTGSVKLIGRGSASEGSVTAGAAQTSQPGSSRSGAAGNGSGAAHAPMVRSGRDYRASSLAAQASALLRTAAGPAGAATSGGSARAVPSPEIAAPGVSRLPAVAVPPDTTSDDIRNPTRLAACLDALGVSRDRLVAVDLASYEGQEAAILLVNSADGNGHEVWAVERTCGPGAEGALKYTHLSQ